MDIKVRVVSLTKEPLPLTGTTSKEFEDGFALGMTGAELPSNPGGMSKVQQLDFLLGYDLGLSSKKVDDEDVN